MGFFYNSLVCQVFALGQNGNVRFGSKAVIHPGPPNVRFAPIADIPHQRWNRGLIPRIPFNLPVGERTVGPVIEQHAGAIGGVFADLGQLAHIHLDPQAGPVVGP